MRIGIIILVNERQRTATVHGAPAKFSEISQTFRDLRSGKLERPEGAERMLLLDLEGVTHGTHRFRKAAPASPAIDPKKKSRRAHPKAPAEV